MSEALEMKIARLVSDPNFLELDNLANEPCFFHAVGRTFTETWHTAFLGWLLDPNGSHQLGEFPLIRFLVAIATKAIPPDTEDTPNYIFDPVQLARFAIDESFFDTEVMPNERQSTEKNLGGDYGRIDVWINKLFGADALPSSTGTNQFICLVEVKVDAKIANNQELKYPNYIAERATASRNTSGICVFLGPKESLRGETSSEIIGDPRWYCMDFQLLYDEVLAPCLTHSHLNDEMRPLLQHYIRALRSSRRGGSLAMTKRERELAEKIISEHKSTFEMIATMLLEQEETSQLQNAVNIATGKVPREPLLVRLKSGEQITGESVRSFLLSSLQYLKDNNLLDRLEIPYSIRPSTYLFAYEPKHATGRAFRGNCSFEASDDQLIYINTNLNRDNAQKHINGIFEGLNLLVP